MALSRSNKAQPAPRRGVSAFRAKAAPAVEIVSIACAHVLAVMAMVVIASLVIYAR